MKVYLGPPFNMRPSVFGMPRHGLIRGNQLYPDLASDPYLDVFNIGNVPQKSSTRLIKVPGVPDVNRTAEQLAADAANNFEWRNYAIATGKYVAFKELADNEFLYADPAGTVWIIRVEQERTGSGTTEDRFVINLRVSIQRVFGRFTANPYPAIDRELATRMDNSVDLFGPVEYLYGWTGDSINSTYDNIEINSDGSESFIHIYSDSESGPGPLCYRMENGAQGYNPLWKALRLVYKVTIGGIGLLTRDPDKLGEGIVATIDIYKGWSDVYDPVTTADGPTGLTGLWFDAVGFTADFVGETGALDCPCDGDIIDTYDVHGTYGGTGIGPTDRVVIKRALLYTFDSNDQAVEFSAETEDLSYIQVENPRVNGGWQFDKYHPSQQVPGGGQPCEGCVRGVPYTATSSGTDATVTIDLRTVTDSTLKLFRNDMQVGPSSNIHHEKLETDYGAVSYVGSLNNYLPYHQYFYGSETQNWHEINGVNVGLNQPYQFIWTYAMNLLGIIAQADSKPTSPAPMNYKQMFTAHAAEADSNEHEGTEIDYYCTNLAGAYNPASKEIVYYAPNSQYDDGTDLAGAKITFI